MLNALTGGVLAIPAQPRVDLRPLVQYVPPIAAAGTPMGPVADMLRLNTGVAPTPYASASRLGLLGGDNAGYPNGRRVFDDVTDISLRVVAGGVLAAPFPGFNPDINGRLGDGVNVNDFRTWTSFPYVAYSPSGRDRRHIDPTEPGCTAGAGAPCPGNQPHVTEGAPARAGALRGRNAAFLVAAILATGALILAARADRSDAGQAPAAAAGAAVAPPSEASGFAAAMQAAESGSPAERRIAAARAALEKDPKRASLWNDLALGAGPARAGNGRHGVLPGGVDSRRALAADRAGQPGGPEAPGLDPARAARVPACRRHRGADQPLDAG